MAHGIRPHARAVRAHARSAVHPPRQRHRDDMAFAHLVEPHIPALVRVARRYMRSDDLAWDAVQETLLSLWQAAERPPEPRPWLFRAVVHRCLHLRRTRQRRWHYEAAACVACRDCDDADSLTHLERTRLVTLLQQAIVALPAEQRTVFVLREIDDADYDAIARRLDIPLGTVRSRLHRARAALRTRLLHPTGVVKESAPPSGRS